MTASEVHSHLNRALALLGLGFAPRARNALTSTKAAATYFGPPSFPRCVRVYAI